MMLIMHSSDQSSGTYTNLIVVAYPVFFCLQHTYPTEVVFYNTYYIPQTHTQILHVSVDTSPMQYSLLVGCANVKVINF